MVMMDFITENKKTFNYDDLTCKSSSMLTFGFINVQCTWTLILDKTILVIN